MKDEILRRIEKLKHEYSLGEKALKDLEAKQFSLRETLLRISGAIQVLEELLDQPDAATTLPAQEPYQSDEIPLNELS